MAEGFDVAVVGGGLAGWIAATAAQEAGATVTLIERGAERPGWGNSLISGGVLHAVLRDPRDAPSVLVEKLRDLTGGHCRPAVAAAWAENAARTIAWIEERGGKLMSSPDQPYRAKVFDPFKPTVPGLNYKPYGTAAFLGRLAERFEAGGGTLFQPARATALELGWRLTLEDGRMLEASAVILADGGFQASRDLLAAYIGTDKVKLRAAETSTGDGLRMGLANGGVAVNMDSFYGHLLARDALERDDLWPYPMLDVVAGVGIIVGRDGQRIVDEGIGGVRSTNAVAWSADPLGCWLIVDDAGWETEGRWGMTPPNPWLAEHGALPTSAPTLRELAVKVGIDADGLGASARQLTRGTAAPARRGPLKLSAPPFHAIPLVAGVSFTLGGLRIDGDARVVDAAAHAIPGLYAAGGTAGGLHGGPDVGYAGGLLEAAVFGLLAGEHAGGFAAVA